LQWVNRGGEVLGSVGGPGPTLSSPAISPDGRIAAGQGDSVALTDVKRGVTTLVAKRSDSPLAWSPDGTRLASSRNGKLIILESDGRETALPIDESRVVGWPPDGRSILFLKSRPDGRRTIYIAPVDLPANARAILGTSSDESHAAVSNDGQWIAYSTDESGRFEVYVRKLAGGPRAQVSTEGGTTPKWRKDGRELFYQSSDGSVIAVGVNSAGDRAVLSPPATLFPLPAHYVGGNSYDVTADGQRFLVIAAHRPAAREPLSVLVNWPALIPK